MWGRKERWIKLLSADINMEFKEVEGLGFLGMTQVHICCLQ